jgi:hypothetical protein
MGVAAKYLNYTLTRDNFRSYINLIRQEARRARDLYDMLVLPGVEISKNSWSNHRSAHVLALGISEFIGADGDIPEIISAMKAQNALVIAAHPVSTRKFEKQTYHLWNRRESLKELFDAWEVASGPHLFDEVLTSGLPMVATSDLHHAKQINSWKTIFTCERSESDIFAAVRSQDLQFHFYREPVLEQERGPNHSLAPQYPPTLLQNSPPSVVLGAARIFAGETKPYTLLRAQ